MSHHGGRQLHSAVAALDALPGVAKAVGSRAEVFVDGSVRRGTDVLKALALGASRSAAGTGPGEREGRIRRLVADEGDK